MSNGQAVDEQRIRDLEEGASLPPFFAAGLKEGSEMTVSSLCHEQRNLLFVVMAKASVLADRDLDDPVFQKHMPNIIQGLERMRSVLLAMENIGKEPDLNVSDISVNQLLEALVQDAQEFRQGKLPSFGLNVADDANVLRADEFWLSQALMNLLKNALEATRGRHKPRIRVDVSRTKENAVRIAVIDNGIGMGEAVVKKAFDPCFTTKGVNGNGFGLAVSRNAIERHGGRIEVKTWPGLGSVFTIVLPQ